jgi:hypothetical protein
LQITLTARRITDGFPAALLIRLAVFGLLLTPTQRAADLHAVCE